MKIEQKLLVYTTSWCSDCHRVKYFLDEYGFDYQEVDVEKDAQGMTFVRAVNGGRATTPTIVFADGTLLVEPSTPVLAKKLNIDLQREL